MTVRHHPNDETLLSLAAGRLPDGAAVTVSVHLEYCPQCRARVQMLRALGGAFLEAAEPLPLAPDALASTLQRIDAATDAGQLAAETGEGAPIAALQPEGVPVLKSLRGCKISPWFWMGFGKRISRVQFPCDSKSSLFLLGIAPGRNLPRHSHSGLEFTQVLSGSFNDGESVFGPGDFHAAGREAHHQPVAQQKDACVCLVYIEGHLRFDAPALRPLGRWMRF